jgi:hypothetical protein
MRALAGLLLVVSLALVGCPPNDPREDAAVIDASADVRAPVDVNLDARQCSLRCGSTMQRCCTNDEGLDECLDVSSDVTNCGVCGLDCVRARRGDRCVAMQCSCGDFAIGCTGEPDSTCCPVAPDGRGQRCANIGRDFNDCGECGRSCDARQANRCEGGSCACGGDGALCAGTDTDLCCLDGFGVASCVDTTTDDLNCGGCNRRCGAFEDCMRGVCIDFTIPDAGPIDASRPDAGPGDAGAPDGGAPDGGAPDAHTSDTGLDAATDPDASLDTGVTTDVG